MSAVAGDARVDVAVEHGRDATGDVGVQAEPGIVGGPGGGRTAGPAPGLIGRVGRARGGGGGLFGLRTTKPLCSGSSLQSTVAPRSFVGAVVGHHDCEIPLVLHGVAGADLGLRLERQRADVFAVGRAGDPHGQDAIAGFGRGGAEAAHALEG